MDYNKAALELHSKFPGKIAVQSLCECKDRDALSTAYTPGVAEPCRKIKANPDDVYTYTMKGRTVAVVTNGTAVLGLGDIGPEAGLPVMEGKCVLFKEFGGVDAFPISLNAKTKEEVIAAVKAIAPTFGGINLEDIRSPECFEIEAELERDLDIPVFHDDQHGTAIIVLAGVLNALKVVGKRIEDVKIVQNGPGAAGTAIIHMLQVAGAKNIVAVDEHGILYPNRPAGLEGHKGRLAEETNPDKLTGGLAEAIRDADIFIGTSIAGALTPELAATMAKDAIVFAMANPTPEIMPEEAAKGGARVIATGRSDYPNQINNVLVFPGIFRGALDCRARDINEAMKVATSYAIAALIPDGEVSETNIIPSALDPRVAPAVAAAVIGGIADALDGDEEGHVADFLDAVTESLVDQRTVGKAQECAVRVLSANTHQILAAHGRLTAGVQIHICTQLLALSDNTGQVVVRQRAGMAVLGSPAAGALQIAGSGGIHQDRPRHIAAVLLNGSHTLGVAVNGYIHQRLNQLIEHMLICIANQISGKAHPVVIRVVQHLMQTGIGGTINLLYIRHLHQAENAGCVLIKILTRILDRVFYDNSRHCFFESHNT